MRQRLLTARITATALSVVFAAISISGCNDDGRELRPPTAPLPAPTTTTTLAPVDAFVTQAPPPPLQLFTPWADGAGIPPRHTCDDNDIAPALSWTGIPLGTVEVAISMTDLDVPGPGGAGLTHWVMTGINPAITALAEDEVPAGAIEWINDLDDIGWTGPCPPSDETHTYLFTVHALNQQLELADGTAASDVVATLNQLSISQISVSGTYTRAG
jgi:Raf kinase inhibitor-like YbhB/YbcL family protein